MSGSETAPCPNCRKEGKPFDNSKTRHFCDDKACPVQSYDWGGKYTNTDEEDYVYI